MFQSEWDLDENVNEHNASVELALSNSYKTLRYGLHQRFLKCGGNTDLKMAKTKVQKNMSQTTWHKICESFANEDWKRKSLRNKANRSMLKTNHTSGSRSFISHRHSKVIILYYYIILIIMFRAYVNHVSIMCRRDRLGWNLR